ncbi:MAG: anthranilate synthase component I family protein [Cryomorphaceae bacterium]|nr:MAG: anthranilate synthase component I family protein [Cryomorphaceae bacterium]
MRRAVAIELAESVLKGLTKKFPQVALLRSNNSTGRNIVALGCLDELIICAADKHNPIAALAEFHQKHEDWIFGYLTYEVKDSLENLSSANLDQQQWPLLRFFRPEWIVAWKDRETTLYLLPDQKPDDFFELIGEGSNENTDAIPIPVLQPALSREDYLKAVNRVKEHIQQGDVYELNYTFPLEARVPALDTFELYKRVNNATRAPFSVYYHDQHHSLICGSPERYLRKTGKELISQPIKGTMRRGSPGEDDLLKEMLRNDPKERAENIMITDLVRNDLSRVAAPKSVVVDELCEIYTFHTVHQMISTIRAELAEDCSGWDALRTSFPMGSMTGAPKIRAMELIEELEVRRRGLYSGAFGLVFPNGDFDFNVVIRSLLYSRENGMLALHTGSAITAASVPEQEYDECMLKAEALLRAINNPTDVPAVS